LVNFSRFQRITAEEFCSWTVGVGGIEKKVFQLHAANLSG
jgi:hypothetical protein